MPLVSMKTLLDDASKRNYGVGAFSVLNSDAVNGIVRAAEDSNSPVILQMAELRNDTAQIATLGPALFAAAQSAKVPVALHLDHGTSDEMIALAITLGFTSVMIDASEYSLQKNIKRTREVVDFARSQGITVEAELGRMGAEGGASNTELLFTSPEEAEKFYHEAAPDALAVSIGNVHGLYRGEPKLQFDVLEQIKERVPVPLVLHGGSGIDLQDYRKCIARGIRKINIATAIYGYATRKLAEELCKELQVDSAPSYQESSFINIQRLISRCIYEESTRHIEMFMSSGKASTLCVK